MPIDGLAGPGAAVVMARLFPLCPSEKVSPLFIHLGARFVLWLRHFVDSWDFH